MSFVVCQHCHGPIGLGEQEVTERVLGGFITSEQFASLLSTLDLEVGDSITLHPTCIGHVMAEAV